MVFGQFDFQEGITPYYLRGLPPTLQISNGCSEELILVRLLLGTVTIHDNVSSKTFAQKINYSVEGFSQNKRLTSKLIKEFLEPELKLSDLVDYLHKSSHFGNRKLFKNFLLELANYFYHRSNENHIAGFLHLYRSLELISFCFPLFFASRATDYHGSYLTLKNFFNQTDGERQFLKKFVNDHLFRTDAIRDVRLEISFEAKSQKIKEQYFNTTLRVMGNNKSIDVIDNTPFDKIVTNRKSLISLMIDLRNRNFHLLVGDFNENISSDELHDLNTYFKNFNDIFCNWISLIHLKILKKVIENSN